jgi:hypothetical protein
MLLPLHRAALTRWISRCRGASARHSERLARDGYVC